MPDSFNEPVPEQVQLMLDDERKFGSAFRLALASPETLQREIRGLMYWMLGLKYTLQALRIEGDLLISRLWDAFQQEFDNRGPDHATLCNIVRLYDKGRLPESASQGGPCGPAFIAPFPGMLRSSSSNHVAGRGLPFVPLATIPAPQSTLPVASPEVVSVTGVALEGGRMLPSRPIVPRKVASTAGVALELDPMLSTLPVTSPEMVSVTGVALEGGCMLPSRPIVPRKMASTAGVALELDPMLSTLPVTSPEMVSVTGVALEGGCMLPSRPIVPRKMASTAGVALELDPMLSTLPVTSPEMVSVTGVALEGGCMLPSRPIVPRKMASTAGVALELDPMLSTLPVASPEMVSVAHVLPLTHHLKGNFEALTMLATSSDGGNKILGKLRLESGVQQIRTDNPDKKKTQEGTDVYEYLKLKEMTQNEMTKIRKGTEDVSEHIATAARVNASNVLEHALADVSTETEVATDTMHPPELALASSFADPNMVVDESVPADGYGHHVKPLCSSFVTSRQHS